MDDLSSRKNATETIDATLPNDTSKGGLTGWAATEDYMLKHDTGMVKDFADDVDTLLVFAGLFSAVLTAFVVESYQLLQADNAENTVKLLARISAQLESFTFNSGFINSTRPALPLPDFTPDNTALWINVLWFLSLLFSLAAALFGILVKQWLREYMQWNSALASPKENVLVRQIRFEAWNEWNMAASISSIPALLEVALILFVCGLVILLWTLDPIVALVITIAAAVFLMIVSSITLLPAFFKRCPYKSPTAWACVILWEFIRDATLLVVNFVRVTFTSDSMRSSRLLWRLDHWHMPARHWRDRDIAGTQPCRFEDQLGKKHNALAVIHEELAGEWIALDEGEGHGYVKEPNLDGVMLDAAYQALGPIGEVPVLFRALTWVSMASQDTRVHEYVARCAETIHSATALLQGPRTNLVEVLGANGVRNISTWYLLSRAWEGKRPEAFPVEAADSGLVLTSLRKAVRMGYHAIPFVLDGEERHPIIRYEINWPLVEARSRGGFWRYSIQETQIITHLLAADIKSTVEEMLSEWFWYNEHLVHGRRAIELLCTLRFVLRANAPLADFKPTCVLILVQIYNIVRRSSRGRNFDSDFPGVRCAIFQLACRFAVVHIQEDELKVVAFERQPIATPMTASSYAALVSKFHVGGNREDYHIFVQLVHRCLASLVYDHIPVDLGERLLQRMVDIAEDCLEKGWWNCGSYSELSWLDILRTGPMVTFRSAHETLFARLLDVLDQSCRAGLLTGKAREYLDVLLTHDAAPDNVHHDSERGSR